MHSDWLSSRYVSRISAVGCFSYFVQVLTGKIPFHGIRVVNGLRPDRPEDAPSIGFSDLLWDVVQRCWDADMKLRPKVVEIVTHLEGAAANWDGLMPPCTVTENVPSDSTEEMSWSMKYCEFMVLILPDIAHRAMTQMESLAHLLAHLWMSSWGAPLKNLRRYLTGSHSPGLRSPRGNNWGSHTTVLRDRISRAPV